MLSVIKMIREEVTLETMDRIQDAIGEELFFREAGSQVIIDMSDNKSELLNCLDSSIPHEANLKSLILSLKPSFIELST